MEAPGGPGGPLRVLEARLRRSSQNIVNSKKRKTIDAPFSI